MLNSAQSRAVSALSQSIDNTAQNDRQLQHAQLLSQEVEREKAGREQAQIQQQQYMEQLTNAAEGLLAGDREKINQRALEIQRAVKSSVKLYGGDSKKFMQSGGHTMLGNYTRNILNSKEFTTYKENKENLVRILDAQQKGLGAQLLDRDIESMQRYQETGEGKITYSGLMQEIHMPDPNNYDLGSDIPISDIVENKDNRLRLLANYKMYYPDSTDVTDEQLYAFADARYGGQGSNRDKLNFARKLALTQATKKTTAQKATEDKRKDNLVVMYKKAMSQFPKELSVGELYGDLSKQENANWFKANKGQNSYLANLGLGEWNHKARAHNLDEKNLDISSDDMTPSSVFYKVWENLFNEDYQLAHSGEIFSTSKNKIAGTILGSKVNENGMVEIEPNETFFNTQGVQMTGREELEPGKYKGNYKVLGISTAVKIKDENDHGQLLMTAHKSNGEIDKDQMERFIEKTKNAKGIPTAVVALEHEDGHIFYKEVGLDNLEVSNKITQELGADAILNDYLGSEQKTAELFGAADKITEEEQTVLKEKLSTIDNQLKGVPQFEMEAESFANTEDPNQNRSSLMKSFYSSIKFASPTDLAKNMGFSITVASAGPEVEALFKDHSNNMSDKELIQQWLINASKDVDDDTKERNLQMAKDWITAHENYERMLNE